MKRIPLAAAALLLASAPAFAQTTTGAVGQTKGGAINAATFAANTDAVGFSDTALTPALVVPATSTAQATSASGPVAATGTLIVTRSTVITACSVTTGPTLPAVQRYTPVTIMNRSGGSCLIWPSIGATVETAIGTNGAVNAPFTMLTNTDVTFRPATPTSWLQ